MSGLRVVLLVLALHCCFISCSSATTSFDYFYFVQQWPGSLCDTKNGCCYPKTGKPAEDFSIHGLWPQRANGSWPHDCNSSAVFDYSKISDLEEELNKYWGSLSCPSSNGHKFWGHEWKKHGTCSGLDEHSYFQKTLALREKVDLLGALESSGIVPNGSMYELDGVMEAIKEKLGVTSKINCNKDSESNSQLKEVYLCVNKSDGSTLIDCPSNHHSGCPNEIEFPKFGEEVSIESHDDALLVKLFKRIAQFNLPL